MYLISVISAVFTCVCGATLSVDNAVKRIHCKGKPTVQSKETRGVIAI
jgi:hypothetical protein